MDRDGFLVFDDALAVSPFYGDCSAEDIEFATSRLSRQNPLSLAQPVRRAAWRSVPSTCVVCLRDQALAVPMQRWLAQRAHSQLLEMETSHSPFVSAPDSLAALVADIAHRTGG